MIGYLVLGTLLWGAVVVFLFVQYHDTFDIRDYAFVVTVGRRTSTSSDHVSWIVRNCGREALAEIRLTLTCCTTAACGPYHSYSMEVTAEDLPAGSYRTVSIPRGEACIVYKAQITRAEDDDGNMVQLTHDFRHDLWRSPHGTQN